MYDKERAIWLAVRRGMLLVAKAIERDPDPPPLMIELRRGLLIVCAAIEAEYTAIKV